MKILTKKWLEKREQVRIAFWLKEFDERKTSYKTLKRKSWETFCDDVCNDIELAKVCLKKNITDKLYNARIEKDKKALLSLPKEVFDKIKDVDSAILRYANAEDKKLLTAYAEETLKFVEKESEKARQLAKIAEESLPEEFVLDDIVGELVYEEYSNDKDYFINIGGYIICIENYQILEREDFKINKWVENNPLSLWTSVDSAELHYLSNGRYELHLLLVDGDKYSNEKFWYFTLSGTNVKFVESDD